MHTDRSHGAYAHELHFDGGCRGNPGCGGCGAIVTDASGATLWAGWCFLPEASTTNNVAEYAAPRGRGANSALVLLVVVCRKVAY